MCDKCQEIADLLKEWADKQGHDRCWYYPDVFRQLCFVLGVTLTSEPHLPPLDEFKKGCDRYQSEEFGISSDRA
jgi:hypothetical protein